ncbi:hypothetical protein DTO169C6_8124 [Paecilomyces variotii]|nr:hypothetical protein DTO169C6_8124 [Paecilomyces variotii]
MRAYPEREDVEPSPINNNLLSAEKSIREAVGCCCGDECIISLLWAVLEVFLPVSIALWDLQSRVLYQALLE